MERGTGERSQNCAVRTVWEYTVVGVHCDDEVWMGLYLPIARWMSSPGTRMWGARAWVAGRGRRNFQNTWWLLGGRLGCPKTLWGQRDPGLGRPVSLRPLLPGLHKNTPPALSRPLLMHSLGASTLTHSHPCWCTSAGSSAPSWPHAVLRGEGTMSCSVTAFSCQM